MTHTLIKKTLAIASISTALLAATPVFSRVNEQTFLATPGTAAFNTSAQSNRPSEKGASALLVLLAKSGVIRQHGHAYQLTLSGVDPRTLWFTDRPARMAGFDSTREFIARWHQLFISSAPNAALVHLDSGLPPHGQPLAVELTNPVFQQGQLTFTLQPLSNMPVHTGNIRNPVLFIDICWECGWHTFTSGVTTAATDTAGGLAIAAGALTSGSNPKGSAALAGAGELAIHGSSHKTVRKDTMENVNVQTIVATTDASTIAQQKALLASAKAAQAKLQSAFQGTISVAEEEANNSTGSSTTDLATSDAANGVGNSSTTTPSGFFVPNENL